MTGDDPGVRMLNTLTDDEKRDVVHFIIDLMDEARLTCQGGYPSDWTIENGRLYWAHLSDYKDCAAELTVEDVDSFILSEAECGHYEGELMALIRDGLQHQPQF